MYSSYDFVQGRYSEAVHGRGEFPDLHGGGYRQNHIAIEDKPESELNKCVSRAHARIGFSEALGFYLQVEFGGSILNQSRTRVYRDGEWIEVVSMEQMVPLHDNDLIELGKAVVLQFDVVE